MKVKLLLILIDDSPSLLLAGQQQYDEGTRTHVLNLFRGTLLYLVQYRPTNSKELNGSKRLTFWQTPRKLE